ncbi:AmmeMemoRadiSam system protein B, partial [bacterium]|nr:AmmeMemoRadiSam system protein B [bacterium]
MKVENHKKLIPIVFIVILSFCYLVFAEDKIKYPNVSGQFYPGNKNSLSRQIDDFFKNIEQEPALEEKDILAIIAPHAGYTYSGQVAAYA